MPDVTSLPSRRDKSAPVFDPENPRSLLRYLEDLEDLFKSHTTLIQNKADKKRAAVKYVPMHEEEMWKGLPEYDDADKSYNDFVAALKTLYPAVREDQHYSAGDMDRLVGERVRIGIHNLADLSAFYREFLLITRFLRHRDLISEREQNRAFQRAFNQDLWTKVFTRLQIKNPDQPADTPYGVAAVFEAASFFLAGTPATTVTETKTESAEAKVKVEEYTSLVDIITKAVSQSLAPTLAAMAQGSAAAAAAGNAAARPPAPAAPYQCHYCGANDHSIRRCPRVDEDQHAGRVNRNVEGKVVLPSGAMVPQSMPGVNMRNRIMEWHRRNPGQMAAANLMEQLIYEDVKTVDAPRDIFQLDVGERIESLERELYALRSRLTFDGVHMPPIPKVDKGKRRADPQPEASGASVTPARSPTPALQPSTSAKCDPPPHMTNAPIHPYAQARDVNRPRQAAPKSVRFDTSQEKVPDVDDACTKEPIVRAQAPVYDPAVSEAVFRRSLASHNVSLTSEELLAISPEVRNKYREIVTPKHVPATPERVQAQLEEVADEELLSPMTFLQTDLATYGASAKEGGIIIPDPFETYLKGLAPGEIPLHFHVAKESHALHSIVGLIDNKEKVEAILDPGSQIIAVSENVCLALGLAFDPLVKVQMQSANKTVDLTLGLARNIPFQAGSITLYLQMHVVRDPAYNILLGCPFDILTQSNVKNFFNATQTITISNPNSELVATIPTYPRGKPRFLGNTFRGE
ncbi:hypothetical protein OE88DRAFT_1739356 [Heliocybe sulcata]|uniref:CCHC-type domain-containing protein n=1 Tax=Heliocybe sulcata TaxID=5364 RepID=A0A5C3MNW2_9AGAM|nr:hypothetical protein OE88DRAFT_1739356 [Heliocybe sulcata]